MKKTPPAVRGEKRFFLLGCRAIITAFLCCGVMLCHATNAWAGSSYYINEAEVELEDDVDIGIVGVLVDGVLSPSGGSVNNTVDVEFGAKPAPSYVFGGLAVHRTNVEPPSVRENTVTIDAGTVDGVGDKRYSGAVSGGFAFSIYTAIDADSNITVMVNDAKVTGYGGVSGGWAFSNITASAKYNTATLSGGTITVKVDSTPPEGLGLISGGLIGGRAEVDRNPGGVVPGPLSGGTTHAVGNNVYVKGLGNPITGGGGIVGGLAFLTNNGSGDSGSAEAAGNTVTIDGCELNDGTETEPGSIYGGWAKVYNSLEGTAIANNNTVILNDDAAGSGNITIEAGGSVYGGWAMASDLSGSEGTVTVKGNKVTMSAGTIDGGSLYGGYARGYEGDLSIIDNSVQVSEANDLNPTKVWGDVYGAYAKATSGQITATENSVTVSSGTITGNVYGSYAEATDASGKATACDNAVTIAGTPTLTPATTTLYGGYVVVGSDVQENFATTIQGNTLNLRNEAAIQVATVKNFENYNFHLPAAPTDILVIDGDSVALSGSDVDGSWQSNVTVTRARGGQRLSEGDSFTLISNVDTHNSNFKINGASYAAGSNDTIAGLRQSFGLVYDMQLSLDASGLRAGMVGGSLRASPEARMILQGRLAGFGSLLASSDLAAGAGMDHALAASSAAAASSGVSAHGVQPFLAMTGGFQRFNIDGHINSGYAASMLGLTKRFATGGGGLTAGVFFENGFDSHHGYLAAGEGDGNSGYYGGGALLRYDQATGRAAGLYGEASLRIGRVRASYNLSATPEVEDASHVGHATYYGGHAGTGYVWALSDAFSLDASLKYFWLRQNGAGAFIVDDPFSFAAVMSNRLRPAVRLTRDLGNGLKPYVGAAYEYEFSGKAKGIVSDKTIPSLSLQGSTGIMEIGLGVASRNPEERLRLDVGVRGFVGKRTGVMGVATVSYAF